VEEVSGSSEWRRRVGVASGGGEWRRRVEEASGGGKWGGGSDSVHLQFPLELPWQWHHVLLEATHDLRLVLLNSCHCGIWCGRYIKERQLCPREAGVGRGKIITGANIYRDACYVRVCEHIWRCVLCVSAISCMQYHVGATRSIVSSHLFSSLLISSHLFSSLLISSHLFSSLLISSHLFSSLFSSILIPSR
jgi:hypothetical protein